MIKVDYILDNPLTILFLILSGLSLLCWVLLGTIKVVDLVFSRLHGSSNAEWRPLNETMYRDKGFQVDDMRWRVVDGRFMECEYRVTYLGHGAADCVNRFVEAYQRGVGLRQVDEPATCSLLRGARIWMTQRYELREKDCSIRFYVLTSLGARRNRSLK